MRRSVAWHRWRLSASIASRAWRGLGGRLLYGTLADRLGVKPVLVAGLFVQALALATYLFVSQLSEFYALAVIFGSAYGGVMPLYAVLAREYFGPRVIGTVFGAATMLSSIGMAFGPLAGGWIFDKFANYSWLFIGSSISGRHCVETMPRSRTCQAGAGRNENVPEPGPDMLTGPTGSDYAERESLKGIPHVKIMLVPSSIVPDGEGPANI